MLGPGVKLLHRCSVVADQRLHPDQCLQDEMLHELTQLTLPLVGLCIHLDII